MPMSQNVRMDMLPRLRQRYANRGREGKILMINELCEQFGYSRKHAIKLLNAQVGWGGQPGGRKGRPPKYQEATVEVLQRIWRAAEQPCGKRLKALLANWLPHYEKEFGKLDAAIANQVREISPAQIDRLLASSKADNHGRGFCGTKPGSLLKIQIPIRTDNWDIDRPGYLEADTVAHCGNSLAGDFVWSVTYTDIYSGWTANRAVWNKGAHGIVTATQDVEDRLPFEILGFDCDNGSEFLNHHLVNYFTDRKRKVGFTRSRPYQKNDNGHVEQKNWTHVRQLLGYQRLENMDQLAAINELYRDYWEPLHNYHLPSAKLASKHREGSKYRRKHDVPQTPCERLLRSPHLSARAKKELREKRASYNPFALGRELESRLRVILLPSLHSSRPSGSLHSGRAKAKQKGKQPTVS